MSMSVVACVAALVQFQSCETGQQKVIQNVNVFDEVVVTPVAAKPYDVWQGFYLGGSVAYGMGTTTQSYDRNDNHGLATLMPTGVMASITGGYNHRVGENTIIGIEGDVGYMGLSSGEHTIYDGHKWNANFGPLWGTVRGRVGYTMNKWLLFGTGGIAFMQTDSVSIGNTVPETASDNPFRAGWVLGAGVEYAFSKNLTGKIEYLHMDFGKYSGKSANNEDFYFKDSVDAIRVGINYHF